MKIVAVAMVHPRLTLPQPTPGIDTVILPLWAPSASDSCTSDTPSQRHSLSLASTDPSISNRTHDLAVSAAPKADCMAYRSVKEILDIRAVKILAFALHGAHEAHAPVVLAKKRHNVSTTVAEKLLWSEFRPRRGTAHLQIRECGTSVRR
ncbi:hypothetical protein PWT90_08804 [Aphanocladium album]|nr:hypothetical protein PWT90_08804 [Aphanocladium album]